MFETSVSTVFTTECQKNSTRRVLARETRAEHGVGLALQDRRQQAGIVVRIVFQVGVLDDGHVARHVFDRRADGSALAAVARMADGLDPRIFGGELFQQLHEPSREQSSTASSSISSETGERSVWRTMSSKRPSLVVDRHQDR